MRSFSHLNSAAAILASYSGYEPFHLFIKKYFSANKKFGSKDRKQIASLCYNYFRLGHAVKNISAEDRILLATFLCETQPSEFFKSLKPEWNDLIEKPLEEKLSIVNHQFSIKDIFPFKDELSEGIDPNKFSLSFLVQPDLFLRIRPGNHKKVTGKLARAGLNYKVVSENCIALPNASKVDTVIELDKEAVVQDYNSQRVGEFIQLASDNGQRATFKVWDCCAASGGKSIMAYDINPIIELTVSDKRASILDNLHKRFAKAGIKKYNSFVADLSTDNCQLPTNKFDLIICDAPCTGSGTWARTPEQLFYFSKNPADKKEAKEKYSVLQKQIVQNAIPYLKSGGHLLYVTCSVFKKENEDIVKFIQEELHLQLIKKEILQGYEIKSDTMFAALFTAPAT
ncbi:MAG TPA: Fmu (Sun) domain-containing protein [Chitinophagaceae bacterium]|nr:Fmu (Sun) domain-containing protein [Chitinophagaceae bacterium]